MDEIRRVELPSPERMWFATRADLPKLTNPDLDDVLQRRRDRRSLRWAAIAAAATVVNLSLIQTFRAGPPLHGSHPLVLDSRGLGLTGAELDILASLYSSDEAARGDPWEGRVTDGRHRLRLMWEQNPDAILPVRSALLDRLDRLPEAGSAFAHSIRRAAEVGFPRIAASVAVRSPLYFVELHRARDGEFGGSPHERWPDDSLRGIEWVN